MKRSVFSAFLIAVLLLARAYGQDDAVPPTQQQASQDDFLEKTRRISELLEQMNSDSVVVSCQAAAELADFGRESIPFVAEHLKNINHSACAFYLEELGRKLAKDAAPAETALSPEQLAALSDSVTNKQDIVKAYVYMKYLDAASLFKEGKYQASMEILNAILSLDKPPEYIDRIKLLKLKCEEQLISEQILRITISQDKKFCQSDEPIVYTLKIENVALKPVYLTIKNPEDTRDNPFSALNVIATEYSAIGNYSSDNGIDPVSIDLDTELKPNDSWKTTLVLDTSSFPAQTAPYRTYEIFASIRPVKFVYDGKEYFREIASNKITVKVFPVKLDEVQKQPLAFLGKVLDKGNADEVFICSLLIGEEDRFAAEEMLMVALKKAASQDEKRLFMNCLKHLTGKTLPLEENEWLKWWRNASKKD